MRVRIILSEKPVPSRTIPFAIVNQKLGHTVPGSNLLSELNPAVLNQTER
jgi:hypothetical protein